VLSIGPTAAMHFKRGKTRLAMHRFDRPQGSYANISNLNVPPFGGEDFQNQPDHAGTHGFLSRKLPACSIVRPTGTKGAAMEPLSFSPPWDSSWPVEGVLRIMTDLAEDADEARRDVE